MKTYAQIKEEFIKEHPFGEKLLEYYGGDLNEAVEAVEDRYIGKYASLADYARDCILEENMPEGIRCYIDYERMVRDFELNGDIITFETGYKAVHIFRA